MTKTNYHTHTRRCFHATGADEEYVIAAIEAGFKALGFSDHGPVPFDDDYLSHIRMGMDEMDGYLSSVRGLADRYKDDIQICCGMEYEYFPEFLPLYRELLSEKKLDYMILGNHFDLDERSGMYFGQCSHAAHIERYVESSIAGMRTGLFACFAHPDLYMNSYPAFDETARQAARDICACAKSLNIPLEYNLLGLEKQSAGVPGLGYLYAGFWEIAAEEGCAAIIGVDAHTPKALLSPAYEQACDTLDRMGVRRVSVLDV